MLVLDWANFALSIGFISARIIKLLIAAFLFVGKLDTPLLVPEVSILDKIPEIFLRDILLHEAHRHPYIEQLGVIYLMKLRYRDDFGKQAGSNWRLLFVYALMPWMGKYRIQGDEGDGFVAKSQTFTLEQMLSCKALLASSDFSIGKYETPAGRVRIDESYTAKTAEEKILLLEAENEELYRQIDELIEELNTKKMREVKEELEELDSETDEEVSDDVDHSQSL